MYYIYIHIKYCYFFLYFNTSICTYMIFEDVFVADALNNLDQYDDDDE